LNTLLKITTIVVTAVIILLGSLFFIAITLVAAIKNWGAFKNCDNPVDDLIDIEDYD
jgi:hypothetical protein